MNYQVNAQYLKKLDFESPNSPRTLAGEKTPDVDVSLNVEARAVAKHSYEVILKVVAKAMIKEKSTDINDLMKGKLIDTVFFNITAHYAIIMTLDEKIEEDNMSYILMTEGPKLVFPFVRRVIADSTRDGGFPPLLINPVDFIELYHTNLTKSVDKENK